MPHHSYLPLQLSGLVIVYNSQALVNMVLNVNRNHKGRGEGGGEGGGEEGDYIPIATLSSPE